MPSTAKDARSARSRSVGGSGGCSRGSADAGRPTTGLDAGRSSRATASTGCRCRHRLLRPAAGQSARRAAAAPMVEETPRLASAQVELPGHRATGLGQRADPLFRRADRPRGPVALPRFSYREHDDFHEQCVERMFRDMLRRCAPRTPRPCSARYTRRGGLDINPWRSNDPRRQRRQSAPAAPVIGRVA